MTRDDEPRDDEPRDEPRDDEPRDDEPRDDEPRDEPRRRDQAAQPGAEPPPAAPAPGAAIVQASWLGTIAFGVTAGVGTALPTLAAPALVVALALFLAGTVAFGVAFARAVGRSRSDDIGVMNLFFLDTSAPRPVRLSLLGSFFTQVAIAVATAAIRANTSLAFGVLVPVYGLAMSGLWAARHGSFPARQPKDERPRGRPAQPR